MFVDVLSGVVLLVIFIVGTATRANIGALGLLASFVVGGMYLREATADILAGFPAAFFLLILGVTYLFSVANSNGTMEWVVGGVARMIRGRALAVPIGLFVASAVITAFGAPAQAAVAILAPIGIRLGRACRIPVFVTGIMIILGVSGGGFSPFNILAIVANQSLVESGIQPQPLALFAGVLAANAVVGAAVLGWTALRARRAVEPAPQTVAVGAGTDREDRDVPDAGPNPEEPVVPGAGDQPAEPDLPPRGRLSPPVVCTLVGFAVVAVGSMVFGLDLGALALAVALVLHLVFPRPDAMSGINWQVILLICGLVTFIAVMQRAGTFDRLGESLAGIGSPVVAALMICFAAALVSAFASSTATISTGVAMAAPLMVDGGVGTIGMVIAICLASTLVDASPFSSVGALTIAGAPAETGPTIFRRLLAWGFSMIVIAPVMSVFFFVVLPGRPA